jgi:hypothetical protein
VLDQGLYTTASEIGDAENISKIYVSRVLRLTLLAPDIVERLLDGRPVPNLPQLLEPFPVESETQPQRLL